MKSTSYKCFLSCPDNNVNSTSSSVFTLHSGRVLTHIAGRMKAVLFEISDGFMFSVEP